MVELRFRLQEDRAFREKSSLVSARDLPPRVGSEGSISALTLRKRL